MTLSKILEAYLEMYNLSIGQTLHIKGYNGKIKIKYSSFEIFIPLHRPMNNETIINILKSIMGGRATLTQNEVMDEFKPENVMFE